MKVTPVKVPNPRSLWSVDGIVFIIELFGVIGVIAATVLLIILLYYYPTAGALWLALPLCLALLAGSAWRLRVDWRGITHTNADDIPETRPGGDQPA